MKFAFTAFAVFILCLLTARSEDLVIKTSGERIRCTIEKEDSLSLHVIIQKKGRSPRSLVINKSEIKSFERDYTDPLAGTATEGESSGLPNEHPEGSSGRPIRLSKPNAVVTIGLFQGSSLIGADFEFAAGDVLGLQIGAGLIGWDVALNFHFKETLRSSFFSLQLWNIGIGENSTGVFSGGFVYRARDWFTCQLGLGVPLWWNTLNSSPPPVMLTYSIGAYFPI